jgi:hypothetical protein
LKQGAFQPVRRAFEPVGVTLAGAAGTAALPINLSFSLK